MHAVFFVYGIKQAVDHFLMDMQAHKYNLRYHKDKPLHVETAVIVQGALRYAPFGVYEYVFPKESKDLVLTTLNFHNKEPHGISSWKIATLRKMLGCEKIPEFNTNTALPWIRDNVSIIPIGVRYDEDAEEPRGELKGWLREQL